MDDRRFIPSLHGGFPAQALTLESIAGRFTPPSANPANVPNEYQKNHNQWPGPGNVGSDDLGRLTAGMGGSYVVQPAAAAGRGGAPGALVPRVVEAARELDVEQRRQVRRRQQISSRQVRSTCSIWRGVRRARNCSTRSGRRSS